MSDIKKTIHSLFFEHKIDPVLTETEIHAAILNEYADYSGIEENALLDKIKSISGGVASSVKGAVGKASQTLLVKFLSSLDPSLAQLVPTDASEAVWNNLQAIKNSESMNEARKGYIRGTDGKFYTAIDKMPLGVNPSAKQKVTPTPKPNDLAGTANAMASLAGNDATQEIPNQQQELDTDTKPTTRIDWSAADAKNLRKEVNKGKAPATLDVSDDEWNDIVKQQDVRWNNKETQADLSRAKEPVETDIEDPKGRPLLVFPEMAERHYIQALAAKNKVSEQKVQTLYQKLQEKVQNWHGIKLIPKVSQKVFSLMALTLLVLGISQAMVHGDNTKVEAAAEQTHLPLDLSQDEVVDPSSPTETLAPVQGHQSLLDAAISSVKKPTDVDTTRYNTILAKLVDMGNHKGIEYTLDKIAKTPFETPEVIQYLKGSMK